MRPRLSSSLFMSVSVLGLTLSLSQSISVFAETDPCEIGPTSCERPANSRFFQMAVWTYEGEQGGGVTWEDTVEHVDIPIWGEGNQQPPGRSIMRANTWSTPTPFAVEGVPRPDWSRVLAVVIDEPYTSWLINDVETEEPVPINPCDEHYGEWNEPRRASLESTRAKLMAAANAVHNIAPRTRMWVNFHQYEVSWMRDDDCVGLNDPTIDVVSLDHYEVNFSSIQDEYDWFISSVPQQQIALVPGTHYRTGGDTPSQAAARLQGYFDYANSMNQQCDMGLGRVGRTGNYDGCRVWIIAGWSATPLDQSQTYFGLLHSNSAPISARWSTELAKIRRFGPRAFSRGELQLLELLDD